MDIAPIISSDQMKQILDVSRLLTVTADLDLLLEQIAQAACRILTCQRASIFLHDPATDELWTKVALQSEPIRVPSDKGIVGHCFQSNSLLDVPKPYEDARFNPEPDRRSGFVTRNLLAAPMLDISGKPVGVIQAINKTAGVFDPTGHAMLRLLADHAGVAIQRYNLQRQAMQAVALRSEMEIAQRVQQGLLPSAVPQIQGIHAAGWSKSASITGGDGYDLWKTADGRLGIFLGDATGHGIGPAMVIAQTRTLIRGMCDIHADPCRLLGWANRRLHEDLPVGSFVTAFLGFLSSDGRLEWCSAGHGPVYFKNSAGSPFELHDAVAPPLGVVPEFEADPLQPARLDPGGMICIPSDGIAEAFAPSGDMFGTDRLTELLAGSFTEPSGQIISRIHASVIEFQGHDEPKDDQSVVIAKRV